MQSSDEDSGKAQAAWLQQQDAVLKFGELASRSADLDTTNFDLKALRQQYEETGQRLWDGQQLTRQ